MQNLNNTPTLGPLMADDFDHEPWHLPAWTAQTDAERGYHEAAHAATELCDDGLPPNMTDAERALLCMICVASVSIVAAAALWVWGTFA